MEEPRAPGSIDEYIAAFPPETQGALDVLRSLIRKAAPDAVEKISWGMPAFDLNGRQLIYFAGYAKFVSLYPGTGVFDEFGDELVPYKNSKSTARFSIGRPLPTDLIRRIVEFRVAEIRRHSARR